MTERRSLPRTTRAAVLRPRVLCAYCHSDGSDPANPLEVDHIVSVANGGPDEVSNLQPLCRECNRAAGAKRGGPGARVPYFNARHFPRGVRP